MSDLLAHLLAANLIAGVAVAAILLLRRPVRRLFGPQVAYGLWILAPLATAGLLLPARVVFVAAPAEAPAPLARSEAGRLALPAASGADSFDPFAAAAALWIAGMMVSIGWLAWRQARFAIAVREGRAGPAVIGVWRPRIVVPDDFDRRYTPAEQQVVIAHEQVHIVRHDSRINAVVALARCVNWFNPLVHLLAHALRIDQELACDARVVAAYPKGRRAYAEAMLKTQLAARPLPMGCHWLAASAHPLAERISLLARPAPCPAQRRAGAALLALLALTAVTTAWAVRPARVVLLAPPAGIASTAADRPPATVLREDQPELAMRPPPPAQPSAGRATTVIEEAALEAPAAPQPQAIPSPPNPEAPAQAEADAAEPRRIYGTASQSWVEPGYAVRLVAATLAPDGVPVFADLTSYGSQRRFRTGMVSGRASRYAIYTSVLQSGDRLVVTATLRGGRGAWPTGTAVLASGETGEILLPTGQIVTVTPTLRPETPEEVAAAERMSRLRIFVEAERWGAYEGHRRGLENARRRCEEDPACRSGL